MPWKQIEEESAQNQSAIQSHKHSLFPYKKSVNTYQWSLVATKVVRWLKMKLSRLLPMTDRVLEESYCEPGTLFYRVHLHLNVNDS